MSNLKVLRTKLGIDLSPLQMAMAAGPTLLAGAKAGVGVHNQFLRHGHKIPGVRRLGQEIAGIGARTALQGKPMMSSPMRNALATFDQGLMNAYETSHSVGAGLRQQGNVNRTIPILQKGLTDMAERFPATKRYGDFVQGIPLESKGLRRAIDYGFTPVGQVAQDGLKGLRGALNYGKTPVSQVGRDIQAQGQRAFRTLRGY